MRGWYRLGESEIEWERLYGLLHTHGTYNITGLVVGKEGCRRGVGVVAGVVVVFGR